MNNQIDSLKKIKEKNKKVNNPKLDFMALNGGKLAYV